MQTIRFGLFALLMVLTTSACGPGGRGNGDDDGDDAPSGDGGPGTPGTLRVEPANAEVSAEPGNPGQLDYTAIYTNDHGQDEDVTAEATFSLVNTSLGTFSGNHFTSATDRAGKTRVQAMARGKTAETEVTVRLRTVIIGPGADASAPGKFGGAVDPVRAPELVYPSDGTLVPPNLTRFEFHYKAGAGNNLFRLTYAGAILQVEIYFACQTLGPGCQYVPDEDTWKLIADAERGQAPGTWSIAGVDSGNPASGVGVSGTRVLGFGQEDIIGGLYYWNAGGGSVMRYDFGLLTAQAETYLGQAQVGGICVGCHALARNGEKIAVGLDIPGGQYRAYDVATRGQLFANGSQFSGGASFFALNADATQMMASNGATIAWLDAASGAAIDATLVESGTMPDWSADGTRLVYAKPMTALPCFGGLCPGATGVDAASVEMITYDGVTWSAATTVVPFSGQNNYYPAFAPSGEWVMFNRSPTNKNSYDAPDAEVWAVPVAGGTPIRLANASTGGDSWPKWTPDVQEYRGGSLMWFTFSSRRPIGLRPQTITEGKATAQIWMAAFDPARAAAGEDPSVAAFWLPFQDPASGNHIAQWVTEVQRDDCTQDSECQTGEFCEGGVCLPGIE
jgi:hypothetical protein